MTSPEALRSDAVCQRTLDHLVTPIRVWTPIDGVIYVNRAWRDLTRTSLEDNVGDGWLRCVHEDDRGAVRSALAAAPDRHVRTEYRLQTADGQSVAVSDCPSAWTDEASEQVVGIVHTIIKREPAGTDDERTKTMSKWAHELRGPLNAILGWSDLLSAGDASATADVVQRGLKAIANNARQQALIIKRMTE